LVIYWKCSYIVPSLNTIGKGITKLSILQERSGNIYELASRMTWNVDADSWGSFPVTQSFFATGEAFAHLRYLEEKGEVERKAEGQVAIYSLHENT
jgi:hypothetical protein